ncbi:sensor histidine kinase [Labrenzia suaedae]|uniref:histidine kinase n=1 Tax=Roseibium litorale TaxID=2803841 RepID=A0ABR9CRL1_9HYPH|nr:sensor histidine kinase [Roseibium litorale]
MAAAKPVSRWRKRSLSRRLVVVAAVWSVLALAVAGFILVSLYRTASERAFDAQLEVYAKTILSEMLPDAASTDVPRAQQTQPAIQAPKGVIEPRFSLPLSGWYWTVRSGETGRVLFASESLVGDPLSVGDMAGEDTQSAFGVGPGGEEVRIRQEKVRFGNASYIIAVAARTAGFRADLAQFTRMASLTLAVIGAGLVGAVFLQVRVGLKPLVRLQASLAAVRRGDEDAIDEDLPVEIAPLAVELNALIHSNREIVERARTHVGNLAHGLKTPLSVISNEARAAQGPLADKVSEQAAIMSTQIQHHLERARMAAQRRVIGVSCDVEPVLSRLCRAMGKIYQGRGIELEQVVPAGLRFRGEQQDLEELSGNLIDNACKWAKGRVSVTLRPLTSSGVGRELFELVVEDDGPGLSEEERREAVKRGKRLDETVPGTGLGLSIVADLAALYGGRLDLDRSKMGGLKASLVLPAI